jgi:hypothetical protein
VVVFIATDGIISFLRAFAFPYKQVQDYPTLRDPIREPNAA